MGYRWRLPPLPKKEKKRERDDALWRGSGDLDLEGIGESDTRPGDGCAPLCLLRAASSQQHADCKGGVCESQPSSLVYFLLDLRLNCDAPDATSNNPLAARIERRGHPMRWRRSTHPVRRMPIGNNLLEGEERTCERAGVSPCQLLVPKPTHLMNEAGGFYYCAALSLPPSTSPPEREGDIHVLHLGVCTGSQRPLIGGAFPATGDGFSTGEPKRVPCFAPIPC